MEDFSAIVNKFNTGDKSAYKNIFNHLYPGMCLFAKKIIKDHDDCEDIVQEVFIELWNQRAKFESHEHIKAFLYLSIKNRCLNFLKRNNTKIKHLQSYPNETEYPFEKFVLEAETAANLYEVINTLPEQQKKVILLNLEGYSNEEISQELDISINTVKLYKKLAYNRLRSGLNSTICLFLLYKIF